MTAGAAGAPGSAGGPGVSAGVEAFVALGSNLDGPVARIEAALARLDALPASRLVRASSLYSNPAVGGPSQPDFINAVALLDTRLGARQLLNCLFVIEREQGRRRSVANAPRTLDLDLALYGEQVIIEEGLVVPHPRLCERAFVLVPLAEIAPHAVVPGRGRAVELAARVDQQSLLRIVRP